MQRKFPLQSVLEYRHSRVERLEVELGHLQLARNQAQAFLESLRSGRECLLGQLRPRLHGTLDLQGIQQLHDSLESLDHRIEEQLQALETLARQIEAKRVELIAARQEEEAMRILAAKHAQRLFAEQNRQEMRLRDDIYNARAHRRSAEAGVE